MSKTLSLSDDILFRRIDDEGVVVDQQNGQVMVVNETAIRVLELCKEQPSLDYIVEQIANEYEVNHDVIESDVVTLLNQVNNISVAE